MMNFTTNGDEWLEILLQSKSLCREFYSVQRDLKLLWLCRKVHYCSNWYNFVVKSMK